MERKLVNVIFKLKIIVDENPAWIPYETLLAIEKTFYKESND